MNVHGTRRLFMIATLAALVTPLVLCGAPETASDEFEQTDAYVLHRLVKPRVLGWGTGGKLVGKVVFHEDFSDPDAVRRRWKFDGEVTVRDDGTGGRSLELKPRERLFVNALLKPEAYVPVSARSILVLNWTVRAPDGGCPLSMRIDYYDADRNLIGNYQTGSATDPTQPTLFQRNTYFVAERLPKHARFMRIFLNQSPLRSDVRRGEVGEVIVTDVSEMARQMLAQRPSSRGAREKAGIGDVLVNVSADCGADFPILPEATMLPGGAGDTLVLRDCPGETARATAVLWSKSGFGSVSVRFTPLTRGAFGLGGVIPADAISARVVGCHYQACGAPYLFVATGGDQVLVPELLLNDEALVRPDHRLRRNYVRLDRNGGEYVDINAIGTRSFGQDYSANELPIRDAASLQPFAIEARRCKQLVFEIAVPASTKPGRYSGRIFFDCNGCEIAAIPVSLEVLPFNLPESPETFYSAEHQYTMGLYYWGELSDEGAPPRLSILRKTRGQLLSELNLMRHYGITHPILIWSRRSVYDDARFRRHLDVARESGMRGTLYLGSSDLIGNPTAPEAIDSLKQRIAHAKSVAAEYGFGEIYFYGLDEARGDRLLSQRNAWKAVHDAGGKVIVSGYYGQFENVGDLLDLCVYAGDPNTIRPEAWHAIGHRLWKYNYPQTGPEDPAVFRRNYGLHLWRSGFDGASTYCFCGSSNPWNDLAGWQRVKASGKGGTPYRAQAVGYITIDGAVPTLAMVGLAEAIKDVRYMALFRRLLRERPSAESERWFAELDFMGGDLAAIRNETIDRILSLLK